MSTQVIEAPPVEPSSSPVFVDSTGRRARLAKRAAWTLAACCIGYLAVFGLSLAAGPVSPMVPIGRFPELTPAQVEAGPVATASPTPRTARSAAATRTRSTAPTGAVAPLPATAQTPATPVAPTTMPVPTSGQPTPTTTESPTPTTSTDPSTTEPAPTSTSTEPTDSPEESTLGLDAQPGVDTGRSTLGGAA
jgi:hypothetical protein